MKAHLSKVECTLAPHLPPFRIVDQNRRVTSIPVPIDDTDIEVVIRGYYDSLIRFGDGSLAIVDWKTSSVRCDLVSKYARSLHAYMFAVEHPAVGDPYPIKRLGLGVFEPTAFIADREYACLDGFFSWIQIERDDIAFRSYLQQIGQMLAAATPPRADPNCPFCAYHEAA